MKRAFKTLLLLTSPVLSYDVLRLTRGDCQNTSSSAYLGCINIIYLRTILHYYVMYCCAILSLEKSIIFTVVFFESFSIIVFWVTRFIRKPIGRKPQVSDGEGGSDFGRRITDELSFWCLVSIVKEHFTTILQRHYERSVNIKCFTS